MYLDNKTMEYINNLLFEESMNNDDKEIDEIYNIFNIFYKRQIECSFQNQCAKCYHLNKEKDCMEENIKYPRVECGKFNPYTI